MIKLLKICAADETLVVTVTFCYMRSMIRGRTWDHECGTQFLVGEGQKGEHPTKGERLFEILEIRGDSLP